VVRFRLQDGADRLVYSKTREVRVYFYRIGMEGRGRWWSGVLIYCFFNKFFYDDYVITVVLLLFISPSTLAENIAFHLRLLSSLDLLCSTNLESFS